MGKTASERQRERRARLKNAGSVQVLVTLDREVFNALRDMCAAGDLTYSEGVNLALSRDETKAVFSKEMKRLKAEKARVQAEEARNRALLEMREKGVTIREMKQEQDGVFRVDQG